MTVFQVFITSWYIYYIIYLWLDYEKANVKKKYVFRKFLIYSY